MPLSERSLTGDSIWMVIAEVSPEVVSGVFTPIYLMRERWKKRNPKKQDFGRHYTILRTFIWMPVWFAEIELPSSTACQVPARPRGVRQPRDSQSMVGQRNINKSLLLCFQIKGKTFKWDSTAFGRCSLYQQQHQRKLQPLKMKEAILLIIHWKFIDILWFTFTLLTPGIIHQKTHMVF